MGGGGFYGARQRTQQDKYNDAIAFIYNARPSALLATDPEKLCADKGVTDRQKQREVAVRLLTMQDRERRRQA